VAGKGVAAVERAMAVVSAVGASDGALTLADLASRTGLYKSTILRLCVSLERHGLLRRGEAGEFRLGPALLRLGSLYQRSFRLSHVVLPILEELSRASGESASIYVREGNSRVCLFRVDGPHNVRDHVREGAHLPLEKGAAGKVLLAFAGTPGSVFDHVRRAYLAATYGERDPEAAAVSCPVFRTGQALVGALTVSGPLFRFTPEAVRRISMLLLRVGGSLTATLGGDRSEFDRRLDRLLATKATAPTAGGKPTRPPRPARKGTGRMSRTRQGGLRAAASA
jgi:DNA-binding IclR family transcriptional regulator